LNRSGDVPELTGAGKERCPPKAKVRGSNPLGRASKINHLSEYRASQIHGWRAYGERGIRRGRERVAPLVSGPLERTKVFRDDGRVAKLLKGLPRDHDGPSLTDTIAEIEGTITLYRQHTNSSLQRLLAPASKLFDAQLIEMRDAANVRSAIGYLSPDRMGNEGPDLKTLLALLDEFADWVAVKRDSTRSKRGPKRMPSALIYRSSTLSKTIWVRRLKEVTTLNVTRLPTWCGRS
jgi:hypothetical protein